MQRVLVGAFMVVVGLGVFSVNAQAEGFPEGLRFELGGVYTSISSEELGEILRRNQFDDLDALLGVSLGARQDLTERVSVAVTFGYLWNSTNEITVVLTDAQGGVIGPAERQFLLSTVPVSVSVDYRVKGGSTALMLEVGGGIQHMTVTDRTVPREGVDSPDLEQQWDDDVVSVIGGVSWEWYATRKLVAGIRLGYRLSEQAELALDQGNGSSAVIDPSGGYVSLFIAALPWGQRSDE